MATQKATLNKVTIISFSRKSESGTVKLSAMGFKNAAKQLDWPDLPDTAGSMKLEPSSLVCTILEMSPSDSQLSTLSCELKTMAARDFEIVRVEERKGKDSQKAKKARLELHFSVDFIDPVGAKKLEAYMQSCIVSTLCMTYEQPAEQGELPMATDEATGEANDRVQ